MPADDPAIVRAADWLRSRQTTAPGDWAETVDAVPGGWYFEYANEFYPGRRRHGHVADGPANPLPR